MLGAGAGCGKIRFGRGWGKGGPREGGGPSETRLRLKAARGCHFPGVQRPFGCSPRRLRWRFVLDGIRRSGSSLDRDGPQSIPGRRGRAPTEKQLTAASRRGVRGEPRWNTAYVPGEEPRGLVIPPSCDSAGRSRGQVSLRGSALSCSSVPRAMRPGRLGKPVPFSSGRKQGPWKKCRTRWSGTAWGTPRGPE